jgi:ABC-type molybdate transport system substrate-binding protein
MAKILIVEDNEMNRDIGPLPADLQSPDLVYMVGSPAASEQPLPAKSLIDFLTAPAAARVYKANGMDPAGARNAE